MSFLRSSPDLSHLKAILIGQTLPNWWPF